MASPVQEPIDRRGMTPLWVISLFVSLSETVLGVAVTQTSGTTQFLLTLFVILFPIGIAFGFFMILWQRPYVFYPPTEFGPHTDVTKYVEAMRIKPQVDDRLYMTIKETISSTLASAEVVGTLAESVAHSSDITEAKVQVAKALDTVAQQTVEKVRETSFVAIDVSPLYGDSALVRQLAYNASQPVSDFLDDVWFALNDAQHNMPPYKYGELWLLKDKQSQRLFNDIGRFWARQQGITGDTRPISLVGIRAGMTLQVVPLQRA